MVRHGEMANIILPTKLDTPGTVLRISLKPAFEYLREMLMPLSRYENVLQAIFSILIEEAMGYGTEFGDIRDSVDYILRMDPSISENTAYEACARTSDKIYYLIGLYLPEFGTLKYKGNYTYSVGETGDVFIRIRDSLSSGSQNSN